MTPTLDDSSLGARPRFGYPVVLNLHEVPVAVVGGGRIGTRKVAGLAAQGALVHLIAPEAAPELRRADLVDHRRRPYRTGDLTGMRLVVAATGDRSVDSAVADDARTAGIWVNVADRPEECDFILPAIARHGRQSITVSTDGMSPALAVALRDRAAKLLDDRVAALAVRLAEERARVHAEGASTEDVDWHSMIGEALDG